jgi:NET1-associated nuclear protein 1 (U3 small nucleolar RNA-associated protein 17)
VSLVYSARKAGFKGPITRLLTCSDENLQNYKNVDIVPTHVTPSFTFNPHNNDAYLPYNKPGSIMHFLEKAPPKEEWILVLDPDMQIRDTFEDWGRVYGAGGCWAAGSTLGRWKACYEALTLCITLLHL